MAGELSYVELGVEDVEAAKAFYGGVLGWTFDPGPHGGTEIRGAGVPGGLHGGDPGAPPYVFFAVDDLDAALERVREHGGTLLESMEDDGDDSVGAYGRFRLCQDDQGSTFGLHEPPR